MSAEPVTFYAPSLFVIFFLMAAMALVIAPLSWIYKSCSVDPPAHDPAREVAIFQFRNLAGLTAFSFVVNLVLFLKGVPGGFFTILPEVFLLGFMKWRFLVCTRGQGGLPSERLFREVRRIVRQFALCLIGWIVTIAAGAGAYLLLLALGKEVSEAAMGAGFALGGLWIGAVVLAFYYFKKRAPNPAAVMEGYRFYDLLWPVMLAFVALLVPLMIHDFANSKDFHEMMHSKRPIRRI